MYMGAKIGHTVSEETRHKISVAFKGRKLSQEHKDKISKGNSGIVRSPEAIENYKKAANRPDKNGTFRKGFTPWNKGIKFEAITGPKNPNWKGDQVSYFSLHKWVERHLGKPDKCEHCGTIDKKDPKYFQWANKSHEYKRDLTDWVRLCRDCHDKYDGGFLFSEKIR